MSNKVEKISEEFYKVKEFLPEKIYGQVLGLKDFPVETTGESYAGKKANVPDELKIEILKIIEKTFNQKYKIIGSRLRIVTERDADDFHSLIHTDHESDCAMVIYIENTLYVNQSESGTNFWEHKKTKKRRINPQNNHERFLHSMILEKESIQLSKWDCWHKVSFEKNTAILFDSLYFHSPPSPLIEKKINGQRLTLDIFLLKK